MDSASEIIGYFSPAQGSIPSSWDLELLTHLTSHSDLYQAFLNCLPSCTPTYNPSFPLQLEFLSMSQSFLLNTGHHLPMTLGTQVLPLKPGIQDSSWQRPCLSFHSPLSPLPLHPHTLMLQLKQSFQFLTRPSNIPTAFHLECFPVLPAYLWLS